MRVLSRTVFVILLVVSVLAPLGHVAVHVEQAPGIGPLLADGMRFLAGVIGEPGKIAELARLVPERIVGTGPGAAGVFPFRLCRQAVAVSREIALGVVLVITRLQSL